MDKILLSYLAVSFAVGLAMMVFDGATGFRHRWAYVAVGIFYLPPLVLMGFGLLAAVLFKIWS